MKQTLLALFLLFLTACSVVDSGEQRLESALEFAGKNRGELEKVLEHYKDDSQKLEAAKFLIRNMPHWYSYEGAPLDSLKNILATAYKNPKVGDMSEIGGSQWRYYPFESLPKVYDALFFQYFCGNAYDHFEHVHRAIPLHIGLGENCLH